MRGEASTCANDMRTLHAQCVHVPACLCRVCTCFAQAHPLRISQATNLLSIAAATAASVLQQSQERHALLHPSHVQPASALQLQHVHLTLPVTPATPYIAGTLVSCT
jgi:hypothetical protein